MTSRNVLLLTPTVPDPSSSGIRRRAAAHATALARQARLWLVVYAIDTISETVPPEIEAMCAGIEMLRFPRVSQPMQGGRFPGLTLLGELTHRDRFWELPPVAQLGAVIDGFGVDFDLAYCFRLRSALALARLERTRGKVAPRHVVDFDDIESIALDRASDTLAAKNGREWRAIYKLRAGRVRDDENRLLRDFDTTMVCSPGDREILLGRAPGSDVMVVPNTVEPVDLPPREPNAAPLSILFVGTMNYEPNIDAVRWFCERVLPAIRSGSARPFQLSIVGFRPPPEIEALGQADDIVVTGGVDSVEPYYQAADIVIAPIRFGGGTRIKILEALGMRRCVVSTTVGAEGIDIRDGRDILIADSEADFAAACLRLMNDPDLRRQLGEAGRETVERAYTPAAVDAAVGDLLHRLEPAG